jgi:hypothetical protein
MSPSPKKSKSAKKAVKKTTKASTPSKRKSPINPDAMSADVIEFITAIDDYKRLNQRPFPNWSEILEVVKALGYSREA